MSLRVFSGRVFRFLQAATARIRFNLPRIRLPVRIFGPARIPLQKLPPRIPPRSVTRMNFWRNLVTRNRQVFTRLGSAGLFDHRMLSHRHGFHVSSPMLLLIQSNANSLESYELVQNLKKLHNALALEKEDNYPLDLDGYDLKDVINSGCNGIVYSARLSDFSGDLPDNYGRMNYPLAIKVCYNYDHPNPARLVRDFWPELVPSTPKTKLSVVAGRRLTAEHNNVVKIYAAFVDAMRLLPRMKHICPAALPPTLHEDGMGQLQTLFIVMPRYRMTLREYLLVHTMTYRRAHLLTAQLLEAMRFLHAEEVAHRDLKSNNILVEFAQDAEDPLLLVCDFGCCLAEDEGLTVPYRDRTVYVGGNVPLRPPEIACAAPGLFNYLNFTRSDLWAAGTIAYEIFLGFNPFYGKLSSASYREDQLPQLQKEVHPSLKRLLPRILRRDPRERPSHELAATVSALSLFGPIAMLERLGNEARDKIARTSHKFHLDFSDIYAGLSSMLMFYAAEGVIGGATGILSRAEQILRNMLLRRVDAADLLEACFYFHGIEKAGVSKLGEQSGDNLLEDGELSSADSDDAKFFVSSDSRSVDY